MNTHEPPSRRHEFYFAKLDTLVRVEPFDDVVTIRASRDTFSPQGKECFIRELAAEGFIDDDYRWVSPAGLNPTRCVRWFVLMTAISLGASG